MKSLIIRIASFITSQVDLRDLFLAGGLVLMSVGLHEVFAPAAWIVPGAVLTFLAIRHQASGE